MTRHVNLLITDEIDQKVREYLQNNGGTLSRCLNEKLLNGFNCSDGGTTLKIRDFLFSGEATNEEIYSYLKEHPETSPFLYKKYKSNQGFIKELCDPENPIFIPSVREYLKDVIVIENVREDLSLLQNRQTKLRSEISLLEEELRESKIQSGKELSDLKKDIDTKTSELSVLTSKLQILSSIESMKIIKEVFKFVDGVVKSIEDQIPMTNNWGWKSDSVSIKMIDFKSFREKIEKLKILMDRNEMVPQELIDKLQSEMDEKEHDLLIKTTYAVDHNIQKVHKKVVDDVMAVIRQVDGQNEIKGRTSVDNIVDYLGKAVKRLNAWDEDLPGLLAVVKQESNSIKSVKE